MSAVLALREFSVVHLDPGTYMWVHLNTFDIVEPGSDEDLVAAVMATPAYRADYTRPFDPHDVGISGRAVHARWWLDLLSSTMFTRVDAADATETVRAWAEDQEWAAGYGGPSDEARRNLCDRVISLFDDSAVFELRPPGEESWHDFGWTLGFTGYHEFVVIDREASVVRLIVASDD